MPITHTAVVVVADDGTSPVGSDEWNASHTVGDGSFVAAKSSFTATDKVLGRSTSGAGNGEEIALTAAGRALIDDADAPAQRTTLGLAIGTDVAAYVPSPAGGTPPTGALAETYARTSGSGNQSPLSTGRLNLVAIQLVKGMTVTTISFVSATTALSVGVNQWFALFDINRNKLRVTNDDTSTAWAANSVKTLTCATTYLVPTSGLYYLGIMVKATTVPTMAGLGNPSIIGGIPPLTGGVADTGLTNPASCPTTTTALSANNQTMYAFVS